MPTTIRFDGVEIELPDDEYREYNELCAQYEEWQEYLRGLARDARVPLPDKVMQDKLHDFFSNPSRKTNDALWTAIRNRSGAGIVYPVADDIASYTWCVTEALLLEYSCKLPAVHVADGAARAYCDNYIVHAFDTKMRVCDAAFVLCNKIKGSEWHHE